MVDPWGNEYADEKALRLIMELFEVKDNFPEYVDKLKKELETILEDFKESVEDSTSRAIYWSI